MSLNLTISYLFDTNQAQNSMSVEVSSSKNFHLRKDMLEININHILKPHLTT